MLNLLFLLRGVALAGLLTTTEYGLWGLLLIGLGTVGALAQVGIDDKYIQQDQADQRAAFQTAFTLQAMLMAAFAAALLIGMPIFAAIYQHESMLAPGLALALATPAYALQAPLWIHYRRMDFVRQRLIQGVDPVVTLVITVALAVAGLGVWAPVIGLVVGAWAMALVAVRTSPYPLRFRYERGSLREYASFSWPLFAAALSFIVMAHTPALVADRTLGLAAVGALTLGVSISVFAHRIDEMMTDALYPAICAVKDRAELVFEAFSKSNRLGLLWAVPFGVGVALFAEDIVDHVIGDQWRFAVGLITAFALSAALAEVAFSWTAVMRALGRTRPLAVAGAVQLLGVVAIAIPLLVTEGLTAFAIGNAAAVALAVAVRIAYLSRLFPLRRLLGALWRPVLPALGAGGVVLALRAVAPDGRGPLRVLAEVALFAALSAALSFVAERRLLAESLGYLRRKPAASAPLAAG
jgi:O-antigen/teichoic acid export membrane protein